MPRLCKKCVDKIVKKVKMESVESCFKCGQHGSRGAGWYCSDCRMGCASCGKQLDEKKDYVEEWGAVGIDYSLCGKHEAELKGKCIVCKKPEPP